MRMTEQEYKNLKLTINKNKNKNKKVKKKKIKKRAEFVLPWAVSENAMYATNKSGKRVLSKKAIAFYKACQAYFTVQNVPSFYEKSKMLIEFFPNYDKRSSEDKWDVANYFKTIQDALVKNKIIPDDSVKYLQPLAPVIHKKIMNRFIRITLEEI